jgi:hypothetical protein
MSETPSAVTLTALERQALVGMNAPEDCSSFTFAQIAERSGLERCRVRRVVRSLARKGMAQYWRTAFYEDENKLAAGYALTDAGRNFADGLC